MGQQTLLVNRKSSQLVQTELDRMIEGRFLHRLWRLDPSLWSSDASVQASIRRRLGWLTVPRRLRHALGACTDLAKQAKRDGFTHAVLIGMGGSSLFAEVCRRVLGAAPEGLQLIVLDSTDPDAILAAQRQVLPAKLLAVLSSKSGTTVEVSTLARHIIQGFRSAGVDPGSHCVAITDAGTPLATQAAELKFRTVFALDDETGADVGGRFSALTYFGLVPAALLGADPEQLLEAGLGMLAACGPEVPPTDHPAASLAAVLAAMGRSGRYQLTFLAHPALEGFGVWAEQLIAESTGKQGKGILPIVGEPVREPGGYGEFRTFVELQLAGRVDGALRQLSQQLADAGHPVIRIEWEDPYCLGAEVVKWELATALCGALLGLNPFDEPNVTEAKERTTERLSGYVSAGRWNEETPAARSGDVLVFADEQAPVPEALAAFLRSAGSADYLAWLSFLPRTGPVDGQVRALSAQASGRLNIPSLVQFGPRYLHSTGQLYKGGPDFGLFILLTCDPAQDVPIPDEPYGFAVLKQAQALGDYDALTSRGRRVLRIHLAGLDPERALKQLSRLLGEAFAQLEASSAA